MFCVFGESAFVNQFDFMCRHVSCRAILRESGTAEALLCFLVELVLRRSDVVAPSSGRSHPTTRDGAKASVGDCPPETRTSTEGTEPLNLTFAILNLKYKTVKRGPERPT